MHRKDGITMRVAIYQFQNALGDCPSCNQATCQNVTMNAVACQEKAKELFGQDCECINYIDRSESRLTGSDIHTVSNRPQFLKLLADIREGKIDAVIMTYMGILSIDMDFVMNFYAYLKEHNVKLATVREGLKVMDMIEEALSLRN